MEAGWGGGHKGRRRPGTAGRERPSGCNGLVLPIIAPAVASQWGIDREDADSATDRAAASADIER